MLLGFCFCIIQSVLTHTVVKKKSRYLLLLLFLFLLENNMFTLGIHNPKFSQNIGHILRAVDTYGASFIAYSGDRKAKVATDTSKAIRRTPTVHCDTLWDVIPIGLVPVAVELCDDAESLIDFIHPSNTFYFFGAEDVNIKFMYLQIYL